MRNNGAKKKKMVSLSNFQTKIMFSISHKFHIINVLAIIQTTLQIGTYNAIWEYECTIIIKIRNLSTMHYVKSLIPT